MIVTVATPPPQGLYSWKRAGLGIFPIGGTFLDQPMHNLLDRWGNVWYVRPK